MYYRYNCVGLRNRLWFFLFVLSVAINCSFTIYFACYCVMLEGFTLLYLLGLVEAFSFCGLGWILTCTSVSEIKSKMIISELPRTSKLNEILIFVQILHACMNLTTNEMFNYKRYPYLRDKRGRYQNPFSRGPVLNLFEFFVCLPDRMDDNEIMIDENL